MYDLQSLFPKERHTNSTCSSDPIEAWAKHMYAVEAMPGFTIYEDYLIVLSLIAAPASCAIVIK